MEKIKEKLHIGGHHKEEEHHKSETFAAEHLPKQYETRTETVEKVPEMRKEEKTEHVPRMHERQVDVEVPKVVMEKEKRTIQEERQEPVKREVAVPTGEYKERVVDKNRHPGYVDTGRDSA